MTRYRTVLRYGSRTHETYRDAETPLDAAHAAGRAWYLDARAEPLREHADYLTFTVRSGYTRIPAVVDVHLPRKPA